MARTPAAAKAAPPPAKPKAAAPKPAPAPVPKKASNALIPWEEQMAKDAEIASGMEANTGGNSFFSTQGGTLTWQDQALPDNQMAVVILSYRMENVFYEGAFNPNDIQPPTCFAFGTSEEDMAPHDSVVKAGQAQSEKCIDCPMNEWGTANTGQGKACRNTRRLAVIPAGTLDPTSNKFTPYTEVEQFAATPIGFIKPPVTSVKAYSAFVKQAAAVLKRPPYGLFTKIRLEPHPKNQYAMAFEPLKEIPGEVMATIMERREVAEVTIEQPYNLEARENPAPKPGGRGAAAKPNARPPVKKAAGKFQRQATR